VSLTWRSPFETVVGNGFSINPNPVSGDDWHVVGGIAGDAHYLSTLGISLLAGRNFDPAKINTYASLQASIALNAARYLKPGGYMYYITCSVFHAENEGVVAQLLAQRPLELERMQLINGIDKGADCMFIAVLKKTSTEG